MAASRPTAVKPVTFGNFENDIVVWEDLNGSLLLVKPTEYVRGVNTQHGSKDAIYADIIVVDGEHAGAEYKQTLVFPLTLVGQLRRRMGQTLLGRLIQGKAKFDEDGEEMNAPWKFAPHTAEDAAAAMDMLKGRTPKAV